MPGPFFNHGALGFGGSVKRLVEVVPFDNAELVANAVGGASNMALAEQLPAGAAIVGTHVSVTTAWTGGTATVVDITIGNSSTADAYNTEGPLDLFPGTDGGGIPRNSGGELIASAHDVLIAFAVTGDDYANLTAGQFTITLAYLDLLF